jgi:hypothetical protein
VKRHHLTRRTCSKQNIDDHSKRSGSPPCDDAVQNHRMFLGAPAIETSRPSMNTYDPESAISLTSVSTLGQLAIISSESGLTPALYADDADTNHRSDGPKLSRSQLDHAARGLPRALLRSASVQIVRLAWFGPPEVSQSRKTRAILAEGGRMRLIFCQHIQQISRNRF